MSAAPVMSITDELIAELEAAANACGPMLIDSAETLTPANAGVIECPVCSGEGYSSLENDYCNFDNHAIGVQFYGIGSEFGAGERYFRAANPSVIRALLAERAELKRQVEGLKDTLAGASMWMKDVTDKVLYPVSLGGSDYVARTAEGLGSCTPELFKTIDAAMQAAQ